MRGKRRKQKFEALQKFLVIVEQAKLSRNVRRSFVPHEALQIVIPFLPSGLLLQALQILQEVGYGTETWRDIVLRLPDNAQPQALQIAQSIEDEECLAKALITGVASGGGRATVL